LLHASPPTPLASATIEQYVDGQTNWIKIILFVWLAGGFRRTFYYGQTILLQKWRA
jgi:hypothetical protein